MRRSHATTARLHAVALAAVTAGLIGGALPPASASADVDDFDYSSWTSEYDVSLDDDGRAVAEVTETLVAEFPDVDQNKGIVRGYPQRYLGAGLGVEIVSVKDERGRDVPYETETEDGTLLVLTGDDDYVHGTSTYVITSTMRDFMVHGGDSRNDEFRWNLLPLNSTQDIGRFDARISFAPELAEALTGDTACYSGQYGAKHPCHLTGPATTGKGATFTVASGERSAGDGVTVAIGFEPATVTQPSARMPDPIADFGPGILSLGALAAAAGAWVSFASFVRRRRRATGVIIAQFDVPDDTPPLIAAALLPAAPNPIPAQFVHLAVQGSVRLEDDADTGRPSLRLIDRSRAGHPLDSKTLKALFPGDAPPAETPVRRIPRSSTKFAKRMQKLSDAGKAEAVARDWIRHEHSRAAQGFGWAALVLLALTIAVTIWSATKDRELLGLSIIAVIVATVAVGITAFVAFAEHAVLTPAGAERYEYLQGVHEFIRVAEVYRLRMLQSYQGAERRSDGEVDVIHLYERLLPYAMLFGEEKTWTAVLDTLYASSGQAPGWMDTAAGIAIGSRLSSYSTTMNAAATYTAPSSSGGSTGGGFSGGGGGGGFSGGR